MSWFETLMGFSEESHEQVQSNIKIDGQLMTSKVNGKSYCWGSLDTPSLGECLDALRTHEVSPQINTISECIGDAKAIHADPQNANACFQVASQLNLLEMVSPSVTPERGVGIYEYDPTQGPACAIAAGAGTIYRNYFVPIGSTIGQHDTQQLDMSTDLRRALKDDSLWSVHNGYALPNADQLRTVNQILSIKSEAEYTQLMRALRIGVQGNTQVTLENCSHRVTQLYCSAMPVAYSRQSSALWEPLARLVLNAAYEASYAAAATNKAQTGNNMLYLTLLGGGAFGNRMSWIADAICRAHERFLYQGLNVKIVSYGRSNPDVQNIIQRIHALKATQIG